MKAIGRDLLREYQGGSGGIVVGQPPVPPIIINPPPPPVILEPKTRPFVQPPAPPPSVNPGPCGNCKCGGKCGQKSGGVSTQPAPITSAAQAQPFAPNGTGTATTKPNGSGPSLWPIVIGFLLGM